MGVGLPTPIVTLRYIIVNQKLRKIYLGPCARCDGWVGIGVVVVGYQRIVLFKIGQCGIGD